MSRASPGLLASYEYLDSAIAAIRSLKKAGFEDLTAYAPLPEHHLEDAMGRGESPVRVFTLVGGLTGAATGFALASWSSVDWPLVTGGKPIVSIPPFVIIAFELTILFGAFATLIGLFINARLPRVGRGEVVYDPEFSSGRFGVFVPAEGDRLARARQIVEAEAPVAVAETGGGGPDDPGAPDAGDGGPGGGDGA